MFQSSGLWHPKVSRNENVYVLFQSELVLDEALPCEIRLFGNSLYRLYIDGAEHMEGPARFAPDHPEYDRLELVLSEGRHVLSVMIHHYGVDTRIVMGGLQPFIQLELEAGGQLMPLHWLCREVTAMQHLNRRINGQLGWMEACDTRRLPDIGFLHEGEGWMEPVVVSEPLGLSIELKPKSVRDCVHLPVQGRVMAQGEYADRFGYVDDDPPIRFISRAFDSELPADGLWLRIDFGKIGLYRTRIQLDVPEGTVVEAGYAESLTDGRVYPVIPLSLSTSCQLDRWTARGGRHELLTFAPRGYRFLELHIGCASAAVLQELKVEAIQRTAYENSIGEFACSDPQLNRIWQMGVDTLRACCEDALIDTPTRERGQWIGDAVVIGMELLGATFGDLSLIRRSIEQASYRRRADGVPAALCPGQEAYITTYSLYWLQSVMRMGKLTGDWKLLEPFHETAELTVEYFWSRLTPRGITGVDMWDFIDWGHLVEPDEVNVSLNLVVLHTLQVMEAWETRLGKHESAAKRKLQYDRLLATIQLYHMTEEGLFAKSVPVGEKQEAPVLQAGYHATVLGLLYGLLEQRKLAAVSFIKSHMLNCFPNEPSAPRLAHPSANNDRLITPSFAHFSLQALLEAGESEFVLDQYRSCWGWMEKMGATTLLEVFDTRWSHCHAWSAAPTWQLSRYMLGLLPSSEDDDPNSFRLSFRPGKLNYAEGKLPLLFQAGTIDIQWERQHTGGTSGYTYLLRTEGTIVLHLQGSGPLTAVKLVVDGQERVQEGPITVKREAIILFADGSTES